MPKVEISIGELYDKIAILTIKADKIGGPEIFAELEMLTRLAESLEGWMHFSELVQVNLKLWDVEDNIRAKEAAQTFDDEFIELARQVYKLNDTRAAIKRKINEESGSTLKEFKCYTAY